MTIQLTIHSQMTIQLTIYSQNDYTIDYDIVQMTIQLTIYMVK